jgi:hypothetical protein
MGSDKLLWRNSRICVAVEIKKKLGETPSAVPFFLLQISHELIHGSIQGSAVRSQYLTA